MERSYGLRRPYSPEKERNKSRLKRHADTPSPERTHRRNSPSPSSRKKKRCVKPVWKTTQNSDSSDDYVEGIRYVTVKSESEEGLVPYKIQPIVDVVSKFTLKEIDKHEYQEPSVPSSVTIVPAVAPAPAPKSALDIPVLGLSTYKIRGSRLITQAIGSALEFGYRLFDTGAHYGNEREIGSAFRESLPQNSLTREDICIISKLDPGCLTYDDAMESAERTLENLQTDYLDIILLYWPDPHHSMGIEPGNAMIDCYTAMENLYNTGKVKNIGVYKFSPDQLTYLLRRCLISPAMLQAEFHPYLYRRSLVEICRHNAIRMQGFCFIKCVEDPVIVNLARKYRKAPAQIVLRWIIQHGVGVLPKSKTPSHIKENANVFDFSLTPRDMGLVNSLNQDRSFTPAPYNNRHYR